MKKVTLVGLLGIVLVFLVTKCSPPTHVGNTGVGGFRWLSGPVVTASGSGFIIQYKLSGEGVVYFGYHFGTASTPTPEQLMQMQDGDGNPFTDWNVFVTNQLTYYTGVGIETNMVCFFVAMDMSGNVMSNVVRQDLYLPPDTIDPEFSSHHLISSTESYLEIGFTLSEYAEVSAVALSPGDPPPSPYQISIGRDYYNNSVPSGWSYSTTSIPDRITIFGNGIQPETEYDVWMVAIDETGNESIIWGISGFATGTVQAPSWTSNPRLVASTEYSLSLSLASDEYGYCDYVVLPDNAVPPTETQIRSGVDGHNNNGIDYDTIIMVPVYCREKIC